MNRLERLLVTRRQNKKQTLAGHLYDGQRWFVWDLCKASGLSPATVYPLLYRWEREGIVETGWEERTDDKPCRRWYRWVRPR